MKQFSFLFLLVCSLVASAQSPQGISYQAVATDVQGAPLDNQAIVVRFSILEAAPTGAAVYIETHNTSTDPYGMFNLNLGMGIHEGGAASSLAEVNWGLAAHFLKVELDIEGDGGFVSIGTQQMMSVPYALYAEQAGNAGDDQDQDPTNELQTLSLSGDTLSLSNGGEVVLDSGTESQSAPQFSIECVDMGYSPICGGIGLDPDVTLGPGEDGYSYSLYGSWSPGDDYLFDSPHWRKFQIHGLPADYTGILYATYEYSYDGWNSASTYVYPEVDEEGQIFFYFWHRGSTGSSYDCVVEGVELEIPMEHAFDAYYSGGKRNWSFWYSNGTSLVSTGLMIDF